MAPTARISTAYSSNYERMSGNSTRILASQIVSEISDSINDSSYILDNACGPGIVTEQIKSRLPDAKIMATDVAPSMISETQTRIEDEGWKDVETDTLDMRDLTSLKEDTFTHVVTNFGLPVPGDDESGAKATKEMYRVLRVGGMAVVTTWADRIWLTAFYNAARAVRPNEPPQTLMALRPEVMKASWLAAQLEDGGFGNNVEVRPCITYTMAASLDELADNMMLARQMFFGGYSDEEIEKVKPIFKEELQKLRTFEKTDEGVRFGMKAWIGIGRKKGDELEVIV